MSFFARPGYFKEFLLYFGTLLLSSFVGATFCWGGMWQGAFCRVGGGKKGVTGHMASTGTARSGKSAKNDPGIPEIRPGQLELMVVNKIHMFLVLLVKD